MFRASHLTPMHNATPMQPDTDSGIVPPWTAPTPLDNPRMYAFLAAYVESCGSVTRAAEAAGIARASHYTWLHDPDYAAAFAVAKEQAADALVDEATRRASEGLRRYKFDKHGLPLMHPTLCECGAHRDEHELDRKKRGGHKRYLGCERTGCVKFERAPYVEHEYSDALMALLLKGHKPETYRDRVDATVKADGGGVLLIPCSVEPTEWARVAALQQQSHGAGGVSDTPAPPSAS
jgi:hypothetical protein